MKMKCHVITSFGPAGYDLYGRRFLETFMKYWPKEIMLSVYHENQEEFLRPMIDERIQLYDLLEVPPCRNFLERHLGNPTSQGKVSQPCWKRHERAQGFSFRTDAYKFCRKIFALADSLYRTETDKLIWLDADVETHTNITFGLLETLLPNDICVSYLDRGTYHSECGFVGYNLTKVETHSMLLELCDLYDTDKVFDLHEWHDSFVFDHVRKTFGISTYEIPHTQRKQPFDTSILGQYMIHHKGVVRKIKERATNEECRRTMVAG